MLSSEQAFAIAGFKGLDKSTPLVRPGLTRSLRNVVVSEGMVKGRGGIDFDAAFSTAMSENIVGLLPFLSTSLAATMLRIGATKVEASTDGGAWSDITGTALSGTTSDRPQYAMFRDKLYFVNEGQDVLRSYNGSGNTVVISVAPWAKSVMSYYGFVFLLNVSDDGSTFLPRQARYSEDPDNDWTSCEGNELNFHETTGGIMTAVPFARQAAVIKTDGVIYLGWIGGDVRFRQELVKGSVGTHSPLSAQTAGEVGAIYLGTDYQLHLITSNEIITVPPRVDEILRSDLHRPLIGNVRSAVIEAEDLYFLYIPLDSAGNTGRIQLNYATGEFSYSTFPSHAWDAVAPVRWTTDDPDVIVGAVDTGTYTMDSQTTKEDETSASASTNVSRFYDTDWQQYGNTNEGRIVQIASKFTGATLEFDALPYGKAAVSIAVDKKNRFYYRKVYDLRAVKSGDEYVSVRYDVPAIDAEWFNLRIELFPSTVRNPRLRGGWMHFLPDTTKSDVRRSADDTAG